MNLKQLLFLKAAVPSEPVERIVVGNPVSFRTKYAEPMKLVIPFLPMQDLHGYSNPWPGGGGKNIYHNEVGDAKSNGVTYTVQSDGTIKLTSSSGATNTSYYNMTNRVIPAGNYTFSGCPAGGSDSTYKLSLYNVTTQETIGSGDVGSGNTFTANGTDTYRLFVRIKSGYNPNGLIYKPMICLSTASEPTTYEPYSNVCPITGWTGVNISVSPTQDAQDATVYPITFPTYAGTVYGGNLTVNPDGTGTLVVDHAFYEFDGSSDEAWSKVASGSRPYFVISVDKQINYQSSSLLPPITSNIATPVKQVDRYVNIYTSSVSTSTTGKYTIRYFWAQVTDSIDVTEFKNWLSNNHLQVCFELLSPITYSLTPGQVLSLLGQNNVWTDTNGENTVTYIK